MLDPIQDLIWTDTNPAPNGPVTWPDTFTKRKTDKTFY